MTRISELFFSLKNFLESSFIQLLSHKVSQMAKETTNEIHGQIVSCCGFNPLAILTEVIVGGRVPRCLRWVVILVPCPL